MPKPPTCRRCGTAHWSTQKCPAIKSAKVAQQVERAPCKREDVGSKPTQGTKLKCPPLTHTEVRAAAERIIVTRDRATYNAYHRDYKKAVKLGMTVKEYREQQKVSE